MATSCLTLGRNALVLGGVVGAKIAAAVLARIKKIV